MRKVTLLQTENIYPLIIEWWSKRNFPIVGIELLPTCAVALWENDSISAIVFTYLTDSVMVWTAYPTTNPDIPKERRENLLEDLFKGVETFHQGKVLFTTSGTSKVIEALNKSGYTEGDKDVSHFIKII